MNYSCIFLGDGFQRFYLIIYFLLYLLRHKFLLYLTFRPLCASIYSSSQPNESILHEFVHDKPWEEYCTLMEKDGCWGDHLTLLAISEIFGAVISIMSSVEGDNFITEIHPTKKKVRKDEEKDGERERGASLPFKVISACPNAKCPIRKQSIFFFEGNLLGEVTRPFMF